MIAVVYEKINDMPHAEQHYRRAVALEPDKGGPNNNLGALLCRIGNSVYGVCKPWPNSRHQQFRVSAHRDCARRHDRG